MADFRKYSFVLACLILVLGSVVPASAQLTPAFSCIANAAVPPLVRAEGLTEKVGDVVLSCTGGTSTAPGAQIPAVNIQVFLNTSDTSRILSTSGGTWLDSLLMLDEPGSNNALNPTQIMCE